MQEHIFKVGADAVDVSQKDYSSLYPRKPEAVQTSDLPYIAVITLTNTTCNVSLTEAICYSILLFERDWKGSSGHCPEERLVANSIKGV